jgi:4-deoxy-L-threo-5-hexosulose-uronate ketol-isomerase
MPLTTPESAPASRNTGQPTPTDPRILVKTLPATHPDDFPHLSTDDLRSRLLIDDLFLSDEIGWVIAQDDRMLLGGIRLDSRSVRLEAPPELHGSSLCERRELAVVLLSGSVVVNADGGEHQLEPLDVLYIGLGTQEITIAGSGAVYLVSAPAHKPCPTTLTRRSEVFAAELGEAEHANVRTIRRHIHADGATSANLVLGITTLHPGSVWNTMPPHTHARRTEVYLYTGLGEHDHVIHLAGRPDQTRHVVLADNQAVVSPGWSIHTGVGTRAYSFVWAMAGENQDYTDMDPVAVSELR